MATQTEHTEEERPTDFVELDADFCTRILPFLDTDDAPNPNSIIVIKDSPEWGNDFSVQCMYAVPVPDNSETGAPSESEDNWKDSCKNTKPSLFPTPGIRTYANPFPQALGNIFFYIEGPQNWEPNSSLATTVVDPRNVTLAVRLAKENLPFSTRYVGTFNGLHPGCYIVGVRDGLLSYHVKGSPFTIHVSRNYPMHDLWPTPRIFIGQHIKPLGVAFSQISQKIYVTVQDSYRISIYWVNGVLEKTFGMKCRSSNTFYRPTGIAVDNINQRVVVTDKDNHRVTVYTLTGDFLFTFGTMGLANGQFLSPWGVSASPKDGSIAIADFQNDRIQLFDSNGNFLRKCSIFETNSFQFSSKIDYPRGLIFDLQGENLLVSDCKMNAVFKINVEFTEKSSVTPKGLNLIRPQGLAIDPVGNLLVCDSFNNFIRVINPQGVLLASIPGNDAFYYPQHLAIASTGEIVVIDANPQATIV